MYVKPTKHKKQKKNSGYFYVILAILAAIIVIAAIFAGPSLFSVSESPDSTDGTSDSDSATSDVKDTVELPFDTGTDTTSSQDTDDTSDTTDLSDEVTSSDTTSVPPVNEPVGPVLGETTDAGQSYLDKIIFIGDSTTYSLLYYGVLSGGSDTKQVWTPSSRTLTLDYATTTTILYPDTGEEITIREAIARKKPEIVVVTLGINGISYMYNQKDYFISIYTKLVRQIQEASPETKIILQSIFPVATNWAKETINNEKINIGNSWIRIIAENTGTSYLDTHSVLAVAEGGYLPLEYQNGDGLHLNPTSLAIVLNYIRTHALPGYADPVMTTE